MSSCCPTPMDRRSSRTACAWIWFDFFMRRTLTAISSWVCSRSVEIWAMERDRLEGFMSIPTRVILAIGDLKQNLKLRFSVWMRSTADRDRMVLASAFLRWNEG